MKCIKCHQDLREGAKFCTFCGTKQALPTETVDNNSRDTSDIQQAGNYLFWHIQPGEIARIINENEFHNYNSARGIIINQGVTALIYAHGTLMATLHGGKYDFISSYELDQALGRLYGDKSTGFFQSVKRFLARLIYGRKAQRDTENKTPVDQEQLTQVIQQLNSNSLFSVVLLQDREFELLFGDSIDKQRAYYDFRPMLLQTPHLDIQIGVSAMFKITDVERFVQYYLTERKFVTAELLAKTLAPYVENAIRKCIGGINVESTDLMAVNSVIQSYTNQIELELQQVPLNGISLQSVLKITCNNEDLERFRQLSHDLYVSEEELNYLNRTNEFKNRLVTAVAQQQLHEARTEQELMRSLQEINKDKIISQDELERFYIVLSRERRIFEAQSEEAEKKAFAEILKTGLLREEELVILKQEAELRQIERAKQLSMARNDGDSEVKTASYRNDFALKLLQLKDCIEYEKVRTGGEAEVNIAKLANELELAARRDAYQDQRFEVGLQQQQQKDEYAWQQRQREQDFNNQQTTFDFNLAQQAMASQVERYRALSQIDSDEEDRASKRRMAEEEARHEHERKMHAMDVEASRELNRLKAGMTAEQLAAEQLSRIDKEAQVAYFSAGKDLEHERELYLRQQQLHEEQLRREEMRNRETQQQMSDMARQFMDAVVTMSGNMVENRNEQRREYRDELHREQERHDVHQDRALNYTTRVPQPAPSKPQGGASLQSADVQPAAPQPTAAKNVMPGVCVCPQCHKQFPAAERFCDECGHELES